ncbi:MAG TPA: DUF5686 family protein [Arachidicoccus soli]|nr:DUF5686 family protein [Arachidicoccus soli]
MKFNLPSYLLKRFSILAFLLILSFCGRAQSILIKGYVRDSLTGAPIPNVSIFFKGSFGVLSDSTGHYSLFASKTVSKDPHMQVTYVGYKPSSIKIDFDIKDQEVDIKLMPASNDLQDVVVKQKKEKYRNKDNPAVELIKKIIAHRDENKMNAYNTAKYSEYEKMVLSVSNFPKKIANKKYFKQYQFLLNNVDTSKVPGEKLMPIYLDETSSENYFQKQPAKSKKIIIGKNRVNFGEYFDTRGIGKYLASLYQDVNIYENNIPLFGNQFLSPIANSAPAFYQFFIIDTVEINGDRLVHMSFFPRNAENMLFKGNLYVTLDGHYAVEKINLYSPSKINLNLLKRLSISLDFRKQNDGKYLLVKSDLIGSFGVFKKGMGIYSERLVSYNNFETNVNIPSATFNGPTEVVQDSANKKPPTFWTDNRTGNLSLAESKVIDNIDSLQKMKSFKTAMDWTSFITTGYKQAGPLEIGPVYTFYSFNPIEGSRVSLGGRTTPKLSHSFFLDGYGAYGFTDQKWKYFGSATYSFTHKPTYIFPQHFIRASYLKDTKIPGQELQFVQDDNFLYSFKRGTNDKYTYNNIFRLDYTKEFENHFSYNIDLKYWQQSPAGALNFRYPTVNNNPQKQLTNITTGEIGIDLRYAPHEVFYENESYRVPLVNKYPVFELRYLLGIKGLLGGNYNYQNIEANIFKRFYLSQFGYTDITFDGGYVAGSLPFPLLDLAHANQTYAYQLESFNLMNFMEFATDHYASLMVDHYFNGYILNKIPLIKKLKWRSLIEGKLMYGGLRDENNPAINTNQLAFPTTNGDPSTFAFQKQPYFEAGVGIYNIFKILRVDYIWRFSYLDHPNIPTSGIRFRVKFNF